VTADTSGPIEDGIAQSIDGSAACVGGRPPLFRGYGVILLALVGVVVAGAGLMSVSDEARRQFAISFVPKPEKYTELYFSDPQPVDVADGPAGESVRVRFTIANHEGRTEVLRYTVGVVDGASVPLAVTSDIVDIRDADSTMITCTISVPAASQWSAVEVALDGRSERLSFLRAQVEATARQ
jgi:hypothetical protein